MEHTTECKSNKECFYCPRGSHELPCDCGAEKDVDPQNKLTKLGKKIMKKHGFIYNPPDEETHEKIKSMLQPNQKPSEVIREKVEKEVKKKKELFPEFYGRDYASHEIERDVLGIWIAKICDYLDEHEK